MIIEKKFHDKFKNRIAQVFLYLIDDCNLNCIHCLYKPELTFYLKRKQIPYQEAVDLMSQFFKLGATKITFMGGEPTLYDDLPQLIHVARGIGYSYIRMDTNGTFKPSLLMNNYIKEIDEITFSLDGYNEKMNDSIRGKGTFSKCVNNIEKAVSEGYEVHITTCVHHNFTKSYGVDKIVNLLEMIKFGKRLGIKKLNMHDLFKSGIPRDLWTDNINPSIKEYVEAYSQVIRYKANESEVSIRMPQSIILQEEFDNNPEYYGYCSVKQYDRILAFPNGMLRICSLMIGTPYCIGYYNSDKIFWNSSPTNETLGHEMQENTPCTNQNKRGYFQNYVPLCVSFKPEQDELIWIHRLRWEDRRKQ